MADGGTQPFVLTRIYGDATDRQTIRAICTAFPHLDPVEVARQPWHVTQFYVEWLIEQADAEDEAAKAEALRAVMPQGAMTSLAQLPGAIT